MSNFVGINKQDDRQFKHHMTANEVIRHMESLRNEEQRNILMRFFKTGKGEYGEGDEFLGIKVPQTREVVKISKDLPLNEVSVLLQNIWHEVRLCGFLILVEKFEALTKKRIVIDEDSTKKRDEIVLFYLKYADFANNWDLVDLSAPKILGHWLMLPSFVEEKQTIVDELAKSGRLWRQRISMVCTLFALCRDTLPTPARFDAESRGMDASRNGKTCEHEPLAEFPANTCCYYATDGSEVRHRTHVSPRKAGLDAQKIRITAEEAFFCRL